LSSAVVRRVGRTWPPWVSGSASPNFFARLQQFAIARLHGLILEVATPIFFHPLFDSGDLLVDRSAGIVSALDDGCRWVDLTAYGIEPTDEIRVVPEYASITRSCRDDLSIQGLWVVRISTARCRCEDRCDGIDPAV